MAFANQFKADFEASIDLRCCACQVKLYARHTKRTEEQIEDDIRRPMYLTPEAAVDYGIIDKVSHFVIAVLRLDMLIDFAYVMKVLLMASMRSPG